MLNGVKIISRRSLLKQVTTYLRAKEGKPRWTTFVQFVAPATKAWGIVIPYKNIARFTNKETLQIRINPRTNVQELIEWTGVIALVVELQLLKYILLTRLFLLFIRELVYLGL